MVDTVSSSQLPQQQSSPASTASATTAVSSSVAAVASIQQVNPPSASVNASSESDRTNVGEDDASRRGRSGASSSTRGVGVENATGSILGSSSLQARVLFTINAAGNAQTSAVLEVSAVGQDNGEAVTVPPERLVNFLESQFGGSSSEASRVAIDIES